MPKLSSNQNELSLNVDKTMAILVAMEDYKYLQDVSPCATNSMNAIKELLMDKRFLGLNDENIISIHNKNNDDIHKTIVEALENPRFDKTETLIFYYIGHGIRELSKKKELYLTGINSKAKLITTSGIKYNEIKDLIENSHIQNRIIILDACHSGCGTLGFNNAPLGTEEIDIKGSFTLASCAAYEQSYFDKDKGSITFTATLLQVIKSGLSKNKPLIDLEYLYREVSRRSSKSTPQRISNLNVSEYNIFYNPNYNHFEAEWARAQISLDQQQFVEARCIYLELLVIKHSAALLKKIEECDKGAQIIKKYLQQQHLLTDEPEQSIDPTKGPNSQNESHSPMMAEKPADTQAETSGKSPYKKLIVPRILLCSVVSIIFSAFLFIRYPAKFPNQTKQPTQLAIKVTKTKVKEDLRDHPEAAKPKLFLKSTKFSVARPRGIYTTARLAEMNRSLKEELFNNPFQHSTDWKRVKRLLEKGADPNVYDENGLQLSLIEIASRLNLLDMVRFLLSKNATFGESLHEALRLDNYLLAQLLASKGAVIKKEDLFLVAKNGNQKAVSWVLENKISLRSTDDQNRNCYFYIFHNNYNRHISDQKINDLIGLIAYFSLQGLDINQADTEGNTVLHYATNINLALKNEESPRLTNLFNKKLVTKLLEMGVDINKKNNEGKTALANVNCNISSGNEDMRDFLRSKGATE